MTTNPRHLIMLIGWLAALGALVLVASRLMGTAAKHAASIAR